MLARWINVLLLAISCFEGVRAVYTAIAGDTIQVIAQELNLPISALEEANSRILDFSTIRPGEVFNVPARPADKDLIICGEQYYLKTKYTCYGNSTLCPILEGIPTFLCGPDCYLRSEYRCDCNHIVQTGAPSSSCEHSSTSPSSSSSASTQNTQAGTSASCLALTTSIGETDTIFLTKTVTIQASSLVSCISHGNGGGHSVTVIGNDTITLLPVSAPSTLTTDGQTLTLEPPPSQTEVSSSSLTVIGGDTVLLPSVTAPSTLTTEGQTITLLPPDSQPASTSSPSSTPTKPLTLGTSSGTTIVITTGGITESDTFTIPAVTASITLTSDGATITLATPLPGGSTVVVTSDGNSATFIETQLPQFSTLRTKTTSTSTDSHGTPIPFIIWPFGWTWSILGPELFPPISPPIFPPPDGSYPDGDDNSNSKSTDPQASTSSPSSSSSSSSSSIEYPIASVISDQKGVEVDEAQLLFHSLGDVPTTSVSISVPSTFSTSTTSSSPSPSTIPCGDSQPCENGGCSGTVDSFPVATCKGNFPGCPCIASANTPGFCSNLAPCAFAKCAGVLTDPTTNLGHCTGGTHIGCSCIASASTPGFCTNLVSCNFAGCAGVFTDPSTNLGHCTGGSHIGCPCIPVASVPTAPPPPPIATSGFWLVGLFTIDQGQKDDSVEVVPDFGQNCFNIQKQSSKYAALAVTVDSSGAITGYLYPEQLTSTAQWTLAQAAGLGGVGGPICGVQDLLITMTRTSDPDKPFSIPSTGFCVAVSEVNNCNDDNGDAYTTTQFLHCQADGNPSYCSNF